MSGKIRSMIDTIITQRSKGNPTVAKAVETKLILKGIDPNDYTAASPDDPMVMKKLESMAEQFGIAL